MSAGAAAPAPTASVAMATFNGARFIAPQLESILTQSVKPLEIVICDDGSTDGTPDIVAAIAEHAPVPIRLTVNPHRLGYRHNFMKAGALCTGDIVFFSDQDDVWDRNKIGAMLPLFADPRTELAYHNASVFHTDTEAAPFDLYCDADQVRGIGPDMPYPFHFSQGFTQAYRRSLHAFDDLWATSVDPFEPGKPLAHDQWFFFLAFLLGEVRYSPGKLARYRQHAANAYGAQPPRTGRRNQARPTPAMLRQEDAGRLLACQTRARLASEIGGRVGREAGERAAVFAQRYAAFARKLERRLACAAAPERLTRIGALTRNVLGGAYGGAEPWRFRTRWLARDILRAISGAHAVPRTGA